MNPAWLDRHADLTRDLAAALRERGDLTSLAVRAFSDTWRATLHLPVTERRETCKDASVDLDVEIARLDGEIQALRTELEHVRLLLAHADIPARDR